MARWRWQSVLVGLSLPRLIALLNERMRLLAQTLDLDVTAMEARLAALEAGSSVAAPPAAPPPAPPAPPPGSPPTPPPGESPNPTEPTQLLAVDTLVLDERVNRRVEVSWSEPANNPSGVAYAVYESEDGLTGWQLRRTTNPGVTRAGFLASSSTADRYVSVVCFLTGYLDSPISNVVLADVAPSGGGL